VIHKYELKALPNGKSVVESILMTERACFDMSDSLFQDGFYSESRYWLRLAYHCKKNDCCVWEEVGSSFDPYMFDIPNDVRRKILARGKWPVDIETGKWTYYVHLYN